MTNRSKCGEAVDAEDCKERMSLFVVLLSLERARGGERERARASEKKKQLFERARKREREQS